MVDEQLLALAVKEPRKTFGMRKKKDQMRLVALQDGELRYINDSLASALNLSPEDLIGRNILDIVLFEKTDIFRNDNNPLLARADDQNESVLVKGLEAGPHILLLGRYQKPYNFYFDWVRGQDNKKYLIASSIKEDKPEEWTHFASSLNAQKPTRNSNYSTRLKKKNSHPFLKAMNDHNNSTNRGVFLDAEDNAIFAKLNNDFMCVIDTDGSVKRFNTHFEAALDPKYRNNILESVDPDDKASVRQCLQSLNLHDDESNIENKSVEFEARMRTDDRKQILWMQWRIHQYGSDLYCLGHDITAAKISEASLKRHERELSEAQALAQMGHWRWVVGSAKLEWSDQIYKIFGVDPAQFTPTLDNANSLLHRRDIGHMMQAFQRAIIEQNDYDIDFRVLRENGTVAYVRCEGRCELDEDGDVTALYGVMQDITEQTEYAMELRKAKDSAEQAYASKSRFLANMSHELRTPLNAIIGFSDMLERQMLGPLGNDKYIEYSGNIKSSGEHLLDLITDILDMSKIEAGKYDLDLEDIALGNVVGTAMKMIESRAGEGLITMENMIMDDGPDIVADRRAVMQIMLNVLSNAVKFTEPGGKITTTIEEFDNHVTIKVTDTGIGIPANKLSAVLLPFEQVSTAFTRNHEGSGLGLAITKELAELHGGMISLESKEGEGTTANIRLPKNARHKQKK